MSQEDVEIVRRVYHAIERRDWRAVFALYDPGVQCDMSKHPVSAATGGGVFEGHEELRRWTRSWYEAWEKVQDDVEELIDAGEHVIAVVTTRGRGRASGADVESSHYAAVWTIRGGKVVRVAWFRSREEALEAAGLAE